MSDPILPVLPESLTNVFSDALNKSTKRVTIRFTNGSVKVLVAWKYYFKTNTNPVLLEVITPEENVYYFPLVNIQSIFGEVLK